MEFRVTCVILEDCVESIGAGCLKVEDWLAASLGDGSFGSGLDQVCFFVVATEDDPEENAARAEKFDKLGKYTGTIDSLPVCHLSFGLSIPYNIAVSLAPEHAAETIAALVFQKVSARPKRLPKGFDFNRLSNSIQAAVKVLMPAV